MIIYRITGRAERFSDCGLLQIDPSTYSTRETGMKRLRAIAKGFQKAEPPKRFDICLEKLSVPSVLNKEQVMKLVSQEIFLDDLIEEKEVIATARSEY
jgi:hypothetical protein